MSFDENDLRLRRAPAGVAPRPAVGWTAVVAVILVTLLTAGSVGVLVASRHARPTPVASGPRGTSPTPAVTPSPVPGADVRLSVPSAEVVWALVDHQRLYRSTDQADHWEQRPMPAQDAWPSISFIDGGEGWLLGRGSPTTECQEAHAQIWHTTDGGTSWHRLPASGIVDAQCKDLIYFADAEHGFVSSWDDLHQPTVYSTVDGGSTWRTATLPDGPLFVTQAGGFTLHADWIKSFGGTVYLQASGAQDDPTWHDRDFIYVSQDGGATWTWKQKVPSHELVLVSERRWLEIDPPGQLDESTNGGQAMGPFRTDLQIDASASPGQILFGDEDVGYVSRGGTLQRTTDGGSHWSPISSPWSMAQAPSPSPRPTPSPISLPTYVDLSAPSAGVVWAMVAGNQLFRSTDGGATWQQRPTAPHPGGGGDPVISFADANRGWVLLPGVPGTQCSQAGAQIWRTADAGGHWTLATEVSSESQSNTGLPFDQCKEYMTFVDADDGFVAGHDTANPPVISRTADAGAHWSRATLPDPPVFNRGGGNTLTVVAIRKFGSQLLAVASAPRGAQYVYRSVDGGATWSYVAFVGSDPYVQLTFVTATRWLVIANDGTGEETADAGRSWRSFTCDYRDAAGVASTFVFADANVGYGTVRGGIQRTVDGGMHWTRIKTPGTWQAG